MTDSLFGVLLFVLDELLELLLLLLLEVAADRAARALSLNSLMSGKELTEKNMLFCSILNFSSSWMAYTGRTFGTRERLFLAFRGHAIRTAAYKATPTNPL